MNHMLYPVVYASIQCAADPCKIPPTISAPRRAACVIPHAPLDVGRIAAPHAHPREERSPRVVNASSTQDGKPRKPRRAYMREHTPA